MIINRKHQMGFTHVAPTQRLGNKTLFSTLVPNDEGTYVKYFSGIDAEIYFEDVFIDDVVSISFQIKQNALPLYGYNSYVYDDIAVGSRIVSGQFIINFTRANYMYNVLDVMSSIKTSSNSKTDVISPRKPLWRSGFDIYVSYGDGRQALGRPNKGGSVAVLKEITLGSCSQQFGADGEPILEVYDFIARDIDWLTEGVTDLPTSTQPEAQKMPTFALDLTTDLVTFSFSEEIPFYKLEYKLEGCSVTSYAIPEREEPIKKQVIESYPNQIMKNTLKQLIKDGEPVKMYVELKVLQDGKPKTYKTVVTPSIK